MPRPRISWNPLRYIYSMMDEGRPTLEEVLAQARDFGFDHVELHHGLLTRRDPEGARAVRAMLDRLGLKMSQFTCAPDFTHPDRAVREAQQAEMRENVDLAAILGAPGCRITAGCLYPEVNREQGVVWAAENFLRLAEYAQPRGIQLGFENHYRDRRWSNEDFAFHGDVYLEIFHRVKESWVGVNFDASNQVMVGEDPMEVLRVVRHKVWHMHASDRFPGQYAHSVIGEGSVKFDPIFASLAEIGYAGYVSLEDNNPEGDPGTERAFAFIRRKIDEHWGTEGRA
jgi:sugar phosphate isomerase/epimerase